MRMTHLSHINKSLLLTPKMLYLSIGLLIYTLNTFRVLFITKYIKIDKDEYSFVYGIISFIGFFSNILLGFIADKINNPKLILSALILICTVCFQTILILKNKFKLFWILMFLYTSLNNSMLPLLDRHMMEMLPSLDANIKSYGSQRLWGAVAFPLSTFIIEEATKGAKEDQINFLPLRWYQGIMSLISGLLVLLCIKKGRDIENEINEKEEINEGGEIDNATNGEESIEEGRRFVDLLKNFDYMFFIFIVLLNGITRAAMTMFLTDFWKYSLKLKPYNIDSAPKILQYIFSVFNNNPIGTCTTFGVVFEILVLFNSQFITSKLGLYWPLLFAQAAQLARFVCYYLVNKNNRHKFILCCLFETMKGLNFALTHISAVHLAVFMCPPNLKSTSTMIYNGSFTGLSSVIAGIIFGFIFKKEGGDSTNFQAFFLTNIIVCVISIGLFCLKYGSDGVLFKRQNIVQEK